jgi:hypothetical protein
LGAVRNAGESAAAWSASAQATGLSAREQESSLDAQELLLAEVVLQVPTMQDAAAQRVRATRPALRARVRGQELAQVQAARLAASAVLPPAAPLLVRDFPAR